MSAVFLLQNLYTSQFHSFVITDQCPVLEIYLSLNEAPKETDVCSHVIKTSLSSIIKPTLYALGLGLSHKNNIIQFVICVIN